ncbi:MAG: histidine kinase [Ilumatobacteraceae bacterium]
MTEQSTDAVRRLRIIVVADVVLATIAALFTIAMYFTVADIAALLWVGLFVLACAGLNATSLVPLGRGDTYAALLRLSIANWLVAIGSTFVATFQWPIQLQVALLPLVLAATFVSRDRLRLFVVFSLVAAAAVAGLGLLQDVTGLSDSVPNWLKTVVLLITAPPFAALMVLVMVQHNSRLEAVLEGERVVREQLSEQAEELRRSRQRVVAATDRERRRIERDLHDGAQSRLVAVNLKLAAARSSLRTDPGGVDAQLEEVRNEVQLAHAELRSLAHGLYPTVLTQHGLVAAVSAVADRSPAPIRLDLAPVGRFPAEVEAAIYFCVLEAVQNAAKHADADRVDIRLFRTDSEIVLVVADDGVGYSSVDTVGHGLTNIRDRLGAIRGDLDVTSAPGRGTTMTATVPLVSRSADPG